MKRKIVFEIDEELLISIAKISQDSGVDQNIVLLKFLKEGVMRSKRNAKKNTSKIKFRKIDIILGLAGVIGIIFGVIYVMYKKSIGG